MTHARRCWPQRSRGRARSRLVVGARQLPSRGRSEGLRRRLDAAHRRAIPLGQRGGWRDFDAFLAAMDHKHRKNIRQERAKVARAGVRMRVVHGDEASDADLAAMHGFYLQTFARIRQHAGADAGLRAPPGADDAAGSWCCSWPNATAKRSPVRCACAAATPCTAATGARRDWCPACISRPATTRASITACAKGLRRFEPGAQGEHKLARGFLPTLVHSRHWIAEQDFADAIAPLVRGGKRLGASLSATLHRTRRSAPHEPTRMPVMPCGCRSEPVFPPVELGAARTRWLAGRRRRSVRARLLDAYRHGIFPWFSAGQPILWWSPDPRMVFRTDGVRLSTRFRAQLRAFVVGRARGYRASREVIAPARDRRARASAAPGSRRRCVAPTLRCIAPGHAHSVEVFDGERLVGGIYGVAIGAMFFGESMFSGDPAVRRSRWPPSPIACANGAGR